MTAIRMKNNNDNVVVRNAAFGRKDGAGKETYVQSGYCQI